MSGAGQSLKQHPGPRSDRDHLPREWARPGAVATWIALGLAGAWCAVLLVGALTVPVYTGELTSLSGTRTTTATLVGENGPWALAVVALPLIPVLTVAALLWQRRRVGRFGAGPVAWTLVGVLWAFAVVTGFSIGLFVLPIPGLLAIACAAASTT